MKKLIVFFILTSSMNIFAQEEAHFKDELKLPRITQRSSRTNMRDKWTNIGELESTHRDSKHNIGLIQNIPGSLPIADCQFGNDVPYINAQQTPCTPPRGGDEM